MVHDMLAKSCNSLFFSRTFIGPSPIKFSLPKESHYMLVLVIIYSDFVKLFHVPD